MPAAVPLAIVGGSIVGGLISSSGAQSAADTQAQAADSASQLQYLSQQEALQQQLQEFDYGQELQNPQLQAGSYARQALEQGLGLPQTPLSTMNIPGGGTIQGTNYLPGGGVPGMVPAAATGGLDPRLHGGLGPANIPSPGSVAPIPGSTPGEGGFGNLFQPFNYTADQYHQSPGYQFALDQGLQTIQNNAAARGMTLSPNTIKDLSSYATGMANQDYQQAYQNAYNAYTQNQSNTINALSSMAGYGNAAATNMASQAGTTGSNISNLLSTTASNIGANTIGAGNALAAGTVGSANALGGTIGNLGNYILQSNMLSNLMAPSGYNFTMPGGGAGASSLYSGGTAGVGYGLGSGLNYNLNG